MSSRYPRLLLAAALLAPSSLMAQPAAPLLVADVTSGTAPFDHIPRALAVAGGLLYFDNSDPQHGTEPWVTDGTAAGTRRLADLCPGECSSYPRDFKALGDRLLFLAGSGRRSLYALHQGRIEELARDLDSDATGFMVQGPIAYFTGGSAGTRHMRTDGTAGGTRASGDFCTDPDSCYGPFRDTQAGGRIYFIDDGGLQVLVAEGQRRRLADLQVLSQLTELNGSRVVFQACGQQGCGAWSSDGTAAGTFALEPAVPPAGSQMRHFVAWRGRVYFTGHDGAGPDGAIVSTDGTSAGTRAEPSFGGVAPTPLAATPDALLYTVGTSLALRSRLADGADLELVRPIYRPELHGRAGGKVYIDSSSGLYATDGTPAGTARVGRASGGYLATDPRGAEYGGAYYFSSSRTIGAAIIQGLWRSDGTLAGTAALDLGTTPLGTSFELHRLGGLLAAYQIPGADGPPRDLFLVDPQSFVFTDPSPRRLRPIASGIDRLYAFDQADGALVTVAPDGALTEIHPEPVTSGVLAADGHFFFVPQNLGQRLYESDGSAAGTHLLFDLDPDYRPTCYGNDYCDPIFPADLVASGANIFFVAPRSAGGDGEFPELALWVHQRGGAAPAELLDLGTSSSKLVAASGGRLLFVPGNDRDGLWQSDGTVAGTRRFAGFHGQTGNLTPAGDRVFFTASAFDSALWVTDLTEEGTRRLMGSEGARFGGLAAVGDGVYFGGVSGTGQEAELGFSDGTPAGSRFIDRLPGPEGLRPSGLFVLGDQRVVFAATGDEAGQELWISDRSVSGTYRLTDLAPGEAASNPHNFAQIGGRLFFEADDGRVGNELWALDLPANQPPCPADRLCLQDGRFEVAVTAIVAQQGGETRFAGQRALGQQESGVFTFFSQGNWELLVKVLDACQLGGDYWVLAAAASDIAYELRVLDRATGRENLYLSAASAGRPIIDLDSGLSCAAPAVPPGYSPAAPAAPVAPRCGDDPGQLCLGPLGRFRVSLGWQSADGAGQARPIDAGTSESGLFTFFSPTNWEMMIKVLDGCAINGKFWIFGAGTTDVGWELEVEDRQSGERKIYRNPLGRPSPTLADAAAFDCG